MKILKIYVIGSDDTVIGFGLIGINGTVVADPNSMKELLLRLTNPKQYDLIIINSRLLQGIEDFIENYRLNPENPILFDVPDETGVPIQESLRHFIKKAFTM